MRVKNTSRQDDGQSVNCRSKVSREDAGSPHPLDLARGAITMLNALTTQRVRKATLRGLGTLGMAAFLTGKLAAGTPDSAPAWQVAFADDPATPWEKLWFLDGEKETVERTPRGFVLRSGPVDAGDAGHAVLWTHPSFSGDVRIEYDFTRLDSALEHTSVCILYIQAQGTGKDKFDADIFTWRDRRTVPKMSLYFQNMICYHVSYACTGGKDFNYVRARRYPSKGDFDKTTRVDPSYDNVDLFKPGETWKMVFEKVGKHLTFTATRGDQTHTWTWHAKDHDAVTEGRMGLRQMRGRESRYENFKVLTPAPSR